MSPALSPSYICHVCGLSLGDFAPWGEDETSPTFAICDCCGVEYGYEDCLASGVLRYRTEWVANGANWSSPKLKPSAWSLEQQLQNLRAELPLGIRRG